VTQTFTGKSLQACKDFLQTAVIIDDRAFEDPPRPAPAIMTSPARGRQPAATLKKTSPEQERGLRTRLLIKSFAEQGIICSALKFSSFEENATSFFNTAKSADIAVVDWEMEAEKTGENALKLISSLLLEDLSEPRRHRLIAIYTGAEDLTNISEKLVSHILKEHNKELSVENEGLRLRYQTVVIAIYAKDPHGIPEQFHFNAVDESKLPVRLIESFSKSLSGILPNTALTALTAIRHSTHQLLARFSKDLDYAYLTHRSSLPKPDDSTSHLEVLIAEEIKSILSSHNCIGQNASYPVIEQWVEEQYPSTHVFNFENKTLNRNEILDCLKVGNENAVTPLSGAQKKRLYQQFSQLLVNDQEISSACDLSFSRLSVFKTRYLNPPPHLAMGVILRQLKDDSFWVCIQPKCDSVRLETKSKKFPLLPVLPGKGKGQKSVLPKMNDEDDEIFCHIPTHPQNCRSIEFKSATQDQSKILPKREKGQWFFLTVNRGLRFQFVVELKDEIIQDVMNNFAATTSRIGTNPSEWLRLSGEQK